MTTFVESAADINAVQLAFTPIAACAVNPFFSPASVLMRWNATF
jgi:hypothetical protein